MLSSFKRTVRGRNIISVYCDAKGQQILFLKLMMTWLFSVVHKLNFTHVTTVRIYPKVT